VCLGCAFILLAAAFPRIGLIIVWAFTDWIRIAFNGSWVWPLLGLIFLPFATLFYVLVDVSSRGNVTVGAGFSSGWVRSLTSCTGRKRQRTATTPSLSIGTTALVESPYSAC
jgi:hypothetical protein